MALSRRSVLNAGKQSWSVTVVDDAHLKAQYISMAAGESTPTRFYADNPAWWVVQDGQIRFTIDGQESFVASKGFLVQVPYRIPFKMETVGDKPSLRFEVHPSRKPFVQFIGLVAERSSLSGSDESSWLCQERPPRRTFVRRRRFPVVPVRRSVVSRTRQLTTDD